MDSLVSVVIPAHNSVRHIVPTLDSILAQRHRPLEILVIDDGSTDKTSAIVRDYAPEVRLIQQPSGDIRRRGTPKSGQAPANTWLSSITTYRARTNWDFATSGPLPFLPKFFASRTNGIKSNGNIVGMSGRDVAPARFWVWSATCAFDGGARRCGRADAR